LVLAVVLLGEGPLLAEDGQMFFFGACQLPKDPGADPSVWDLWFKVCVKARAGAEITFISGNPEENYWVRYGTAYGAVHLNSWMSFHVQVAATDFLPLAEEAKERQDRHRDFAILRLGNPVVHHFRLTAGRMELPFGVNTSSVTESYKISENKEFWNSPDYATVATIDTQTALQLDIGYARNKLNPENDVKNPEELLPQEVDGNEKDKQLNQAVSLRMMYDTAALDGSRFVISGYGESEGIRRLGFGFIVVSAKADKTNAEIIRRMATPKGFAAPSEQLIRVGYTGAWRGQTRWAVQFDDESHRHRMGTIGHDLLFYNHMIMRFAVSHSKSESGDGIRRWYLTTGLEAKL
jgi:hypothetical protein